MVIIILFWIILFSVLGSVGAIILAAAFVFLGEKHQKTLVPLLIAFATGILLAAAFLGLIPEAIEEVEERAKKLKAGEDAEKDKAKSTKK